MKKLFPTLVLAAGLALSLTACDTNEGPAEKMGEKIDETVDKIKHGDEGTLEKAGRKADEAMEDVKEKLED
jgi:predicted small secreted protein